MRAILVIAIITLSLLGVGVALISLGSSSGACPAMVCVSNQVLIGYLLVVVGVLLDVVVALITVFHALRRSDGMTVGVLALSDLASVVVFVNVVLLRQMPQPTLGVVALLTAAVAAALAALLYSLLAKQRMPRIVAIGGLAVLTFVMALVAAPPWAGS